VHDPQEAVIPGFRSMKQLGVLLPPLDRMLVHRRATLAAFFPFFSGTHFIHLGGEKVDRV